MKFYLDTYFNKEEVELLNSSMKTRHDAQYYADRAISTQVYRQMSKNAPLFFAKCKDVAQKISYKEIEIIRKKLCRY